MTEQRLPAAPRSATLNKQFRLAERLWNAREDVRLAYGDLTSWDTWFWFLWHGTKDHPEVDRVRFPSPPDRLRHRVVGGMDERTYFESGLVDARRMVLSLEDAGAELQGGGGSLYSTSVAVADD